MPIMSVTTKVTMTNLEATEMRLRDVIRSFVRATTTLPHCFQPFH